jgi:organic hydroperoxide reductase OsmC/OhrA
MIKFPMKFEVQAAAGPGSSSTWSAQTEHLPPISSAIPPEFMGPGGGYSPEDLFALSLLNCLIATFKVYCEKSNLLFQEIKGRVNLTVDKIPGQTGFAMTQADIFFDISGASDPEKGKTLLEKAIKDCAVSNSIKTGKTFHINFS